RLVAESAARHGTGAEFELLDTGIFDDNRYFDIVIEHAKVDEEDIIVRIEAFNRGPEDAELHVIPQMWFRNTWAWGPVRKSEPRIALGERGARFLTLVADDEKAEPPTNLTFEYRLGRRYLYVPAEGTPLFTDNETNAPVVWGEGAQSASRFVKDAFHR